MDEARTDSPTQPVFSDYDWVVVVPARLRSKDSLIQLLADKLGFPKHFGNNWDALADCLHDLDWLPEGHIHLVHEDLPLGDDREEATKYVDVLLDAQEKWQQDGHQRLTAVFPAKLKDIILSLRRLP